MSKEKICEICGNTFKPKVNNQKTCSMECRKKMELESSKKYIEKYRDEAFDVNEYTDENIYIREDERKSKPSEEYIKSVLSLLRDFGINPKKIPIFETIVEIENWKKKLIKEALS